jgi:hypothetical protein
VIASPNTGQKSNRKENRNRPSASDDREIPQRQRILVVDKPQCKRKKSGQYMGPLATPLQCQQRSARVARRRTGAGSINGVRIQSIVTNSGGDRRESRTHDPIASG